MVYLFESELQNSKILSLALISIYGIGRANAVFICKRLGFSKNMKVKDLSKEQLNKLIKTIESLNILVAEDLLKSRLFVSKKLVAIKSYRGLRRYQGLPIRGQRTHTNAKTSRKRFR